MELKHLSVELQDGVPSYMVLRGTYGEKIHGAFGMSRQGVRWRFHRLFNDIYVSAFESILFIEKVFGTDLRDHAIQISRERYELRQRLAAQGFQSANTLVFRREAASNDPVSSDPTLTRESPSEPGPSSSRRERASSLPDTPEDPPL